MANFNSSTRFSGNTFFKYGIRSSGIDVSKTGKVIMIRKEDLIEKKGRIEVEFMGIKEDLEVDFLPMKVKREKDNYH